MARPHLAAVLFQLRDFWAGGAVERSRRGGKERIGRALCLGRQRGNCLIIRKLTGEETKRLFCVDIQYALYKRNLAARVVVTFHTSSRIFEIEHVLYPDGLRVSYIAMLGTTKEWHPAFFTGNDLFSPENIAVLILNQPLENKELLLKTCKNASTIICADGGANRLKDLNLSTEEEQISHINFVCGDLDSVRPDVLAHYTARGTAVIKDGSLYATDLDKGLAQIRHENMHAEVAIFGGLGGRADQAFSIFHQLYKNAISMPEAGDLYLVTEESIVFLLEKGMNCIHSPVRAKLFTENVGIIPIAKPSVITTKGLEWDVTDWATEFGKQISTSNHIKQDLVYVETTERVLFTLELQR